MVNKIYQCFMKSIYEFVNKVIQGDCVEVMAQMPAGSVDLIVTDPPYIVGYVSRDGRSIANDKTDEWLMPAVMQMYRVLKYPSFAVSFCGWNRIDRFFAAYVATVLFLAPIAGFAFLASAHGALPTIAA